ncbi:ATP-binding protein [Streptomyces sp. NPDC051940]|uniref:sensor histidine kinase n=1 Tax=Streptomyces sp. NPDC051940 TaxID=3155675 RepID=UPI003435E6E6
MHTHENAHAGRAATRRERRRGARRLPVRLRAALVVVGIAVLAAGAPGIAGSYRAGNAARTGAQHADAVGELQLEGVLLALCLLLAVGVVVHAWRVDGRRSTEDGDALAVQLTAVRTELADTRDAHTAERDTLLRERAALTQRIASLQDSVQGTFVGLSRRTLGLVERQLAFIDRLEEHEQDPDSLDTLFKLDHLAACMRRHSENLLVLAGADQRGAKREHVPLIDVLRGAVGEIEAYQRVVIRPGLPVVQLNGFASGDTSHLLAELLENATACSPPTGQVELGGRLLEGGELMLTVRDEGIGIMPAERLAEFNERLMEIEPGPPAGEERGLGLYVVARLAGRHGVRVRLHTQAHGLTAEVRLPARLVVAAPEAPAPEPGVVPPPVVVPQQSAVPPPVAVPHQSAVPQPVAAPQAPPAPPSAPGPQPGPIPRPGPAPMPVTVPSQPQPQPQPVPVEHADAATPEHARAAPAPEQAAARPAPRPGQWQQAETASGGALPRRTPVPRPGGMPRPNVPPSPSAPVDAAQVRRRLAGLQQGSREGWRAAAAETGALGQRGPSSNDREQGT